MRVLQENPLLTAAAAAALVAGAFLLSSFLGERSLRCSLAPSYSRSADATADLAEALLHYATSPVVPQQSRAEIRPSFDVLRHHAPCNFMVFGLGRDSQIWAAHNTGGTIVFLEEDSEWYSTVLKEASQLRAQYVKYRTQLSEATSLLRGYKSEAMYRPGRAAGVAGLRGNGGSRLALTGMPGGVYERERDVVVIDAPRGTSRSPEALGRMGAIYSAAVTARGRRGAGKTDVFLHHVDRSVEKSYAMEFLCDKCRVGGTGRL